MRGSKRTIGLWTVGTILLSALIWSTLSPGSVPDKTSNSERYKPDFTGAKMVELYAPYCTACKEMAPLVDTLAGSCEHQGVRVEKLDISEEKNEHIINELGVNAVPTFIFIDEIGVETTRLEGRQSAETLIEHLAQIGGAKCNIES